MQVWVQDWQMQLFREDFCTLCVQKRIEVALLEEGCTEPDGISGYESIPKLACLSSVYSFGQNWEDKNHIHSESPLQFVKR